MINLANRFKKMKFYYRLIFKLSIVFIIFTLLNYFSDDFIQSFEYVSFVKRQIIKSKCLFNYEVNIPNYMKSKNNNNNNNVKLVNACIIIVLRNKDLCDLITTITQFEKNFNQIYNYPYVLMSDEPFDEEFKQTIVKYTQSKVEFALIPKNEWSIPDNIDKDKLKLSIDSIGKNVGYRHLCRYYSGFFWRHELTLKYDYYMRLDPHVNFPCQIKQDPFLSMLKNNQSYGFVISAPEALFTIPTLWENIRGWIKTEPVDNKAIQFISDDNGLTLKKSLCMFYNNFEMGAFSLFRNDKYLSFFNHLDKTGGFYHERWGDAPVHTYYALLTLKLNEIHRFKNIGYNHQLWTNWPTDNSKCDEIKFPILNKCTEYWDKLVE
jgi:alpha 1,2-mannosyltransferase